MHTPPKSFHPSMEKTHTNGKKKNTGAYVKKEIGTQNITETEEKKEGRNTHYKGQQEIQIKVVVHKQKNKTPTKT